MEVESGSSTPGECKIGGFTFFSNFDSGNLAQIELVSSFGDESDPAAPSTSLLGASQALSSAPALSRPSTSSSFSNQPRSVGSDPTQYEFDLMTKPDCAGTEFENGNRTWFYFGMRGGPPGAVLSFRLKNLNKQAKLFSQGMAPVFLIPGRTNGWERVRDQPTYSTQDNNFMMSFRYRNVETDWSDSSAVFFAFTYPYGYKELQGNLGRLEKKYQNGQLGFDQIAGLHESAIYFHRELVTYSLEKRRLDLITLSGLNGILPEREPHMEGLFPSGGERPYKFKGKKVIFFSARVHPGETCSSHVMNGLLKFLLDAKDARAQTLRRKYVFKLVPMLNPDGVFNGHYRTDTRGVNLNRVYSAPSSTYHPTIYAAKKLILMAHLGTDVDLDLDKQSNNNVLVDGNANTKPGGDLEDMLKKVDTSSNDTLAPLTEPEWYKPQNFWEPGFARYSRGRTSTSSRVSTSSRSSNVSGSTHSHVTSISPVKGAGAPDLALNWYEMTETSRFSEGDESVADFSTSSYSLGPLVGNPNFTARHHHLNGSDESGFLPPDNSSLGFRRTNFSGAFKPKIPSDSHSAGISDLRKDQEEHSDNNVAEEEDIPLYKPSGSSESGLFLYVDIHGHASKRGIFMYGNHFENIETKITTLLFPKLMAINSANFDFPACNFTQRNMILKDRHTGAGREGSGRVSVYKATGLTYCYTLECNFNTGRHTNAVPMAAREGGRVSPPPSYDLPPKYNTSIYEECGKYMAVSVLDLTETNPWTRLPCSSCKNMKGLRSWIRQYIKNAEAEALASKANKSSKGSPMRTRLRSLSATPKKTPLKARRILSASLETSQSTPKTIPKLSRKSLKQSSQSSSLSNLKLNRQMSRSKLAKLSEEDKKPGSGKKKPRRPLSKSGSKVAPKTGSKPNSRASSPRRVKGESKGSIKGTKKIPLKVSRKASDDHPSPVEGGSLSLKKRKKKKKLNPCQEPSR